MIFFHRVFSRLSFSFSFFLLLLLSCRLTSKYVYWRTTLLPSKLESYEMQIIAITRWADGEILNLKIASGICLNKSPAANIVLFLSHFVRTPVRKTIKPLETSPSPVSAARESYFIVSLFISEHSCVLSYHRVTYFLLRRFPQPN